MNSRTVAIFEKMLDYCSQIKEARARFGNSLEDFLADTHYRNSCCMCLLQIGELAGKLSDEERAAYAHLPWRNMRGLRNICAHAYGSIDYSLIWETISRDIPALEADMKRIMEA